jgi:TRAP-type mannitol/chloroaromatic compound transport system permease small subunit
MLRLTGAASGEQADINFPIKSDEASVASSSQEQSSGGPPSWAAWVFLTAAFVLLVLAVLVAARRFRALRTRHSHHTRAPAPASEQEPARAS